MIKHMKKNELATIIADPLWSSRGLGSFVCVGLPSPGILLSSCPFELLQFLLTFQISLHHSF